VTSAEFSEPHRAVTSPVGRRKKITVALLQTQAEGAGAQEISRILGDGLASKSFDVHHVFLFRRTGAFDTVPQVFYCAEERPRGPVAMLRMAMRLVRHLRKIGPDALISFQHYGNIAGALAAVAAGTPIMIANRTSARAHIPGWLAAIDLVFGLSGLYSKVVTNSASVDQEYRSYPGAYRSRVVRIDHGFAPKTSSFDQQAARKTLGLPDDATLLGCVARLAPMKNLQAIIELLPGNRTWHAAFAGQGPSRDDLQRFAAQLGVSERVHFLGELSPEAIGHFLKAIDVFVFPSLAETFGLAAVEAAQAGVPVVSNDLEVMREVLTAGGEECAAFVDATDMHALSEAVREVLGDQVLRDRLVVAGTRLASRYPAERMVGAYKDLIEVRR
jgi:hypothetical protein